MKVENADVLIPISVAESTENNFKLFAVEKTWAKKTNPLSEPEVAPALVKSMVKNSSVGRTNSKTKKVRRLYAAPSEQAAHSRLYDKTPGAKPSIHLPHS